MSELNIWLRFGLAVLATWRITHLLAREDGPADLIARLRMLLGHGFFGRLIDCFQCVSVWAITFDGLTANSRDGSPGDSESFLTLFGFQGSAGECRGDGFARKYQDPKIPKISKNPPENPSTPQLRLQNPRPQNQNRPGIIP